MDIGNTIKEVRKEYKEYLTRMHPEWKEATINTHVSDSFYAWNNTLVLSFWKSLLDDKAMESARTAIYEYLKNDILSDSAEGRTKAYFKDLTALKEFLDATYDGVKNRVGYEFDCEKTVYKYAKLVYDKKMSKDEAVSHMAKEVPCFNETTHKMVHNIFAAMMEGSKYTGRINTETTIYFIEQIGKDYGLDKMKNALIATQENIKLMYEHSGNKSNSFCRFCRKIADNYGFDISFGESIFNDIIAVQGSIDDILSDREGKRYWIYSPYDKWDEFCNSGVFTIGRDYLGDPTLYESRSDMQGAMLDYGTERNATTYKNASLEVWQFIYDIKPGDVVFAKKGTKTLLGKGVVISDFIYDEKKPSDFKYYRKIKWTHIGEWEHPGKAVKKALMDITSYTDYVNQLNAIFGTDDNEETEISYDAYSEDDFLRDVYMDEEGYHTLKTLLLRKKNLILQGAPGVGKTYVAKRLAYSIIGEKNSSRVKMVQFHQSYSYEDFIMGFRPTQTGFELKEGAFYKFCKQAEEDDCPYFFIIDEINRGNLSKIFGELFMLLENDKRGVELELLYREELFSIPANVYIIGMMNTADRSLAMMDYALRRRFAFFNMIPAFSSKRFIADMKEINNTKYNNLIHTVEKLNDAIKADETLGEGFCIGHSYFSRYNVVDDEWLKAVVEFELIPLLKEYWFDEPSKVDTWSNVLQEVVK